MKIILKSIALIVLVFITISCTGKDLTPLTPEERAAKKAEQSVWERNAQRARGGP